MAGVIFFKSTNVWGGGERLTISMMEIVSKFKIKNLKLKNVLLISNYHRLLGEAEQKNLAARFFDLGPEVARRRDMPGYAWRLPKLKRQIHELLADSKSQGFGTVVLQSLNERLIVTPIARKLGYRIFWLELQPWTPYLVKHPWFKILKDRSRLVEKIIVNSQFARHELREYGIDETKIFVLYSPIDTKHFKPVETFNRRTLDKFIIASVARLNKEKGLDVLIEAMKLLFKREREPIVQQFSTEDLNSQKIILNIIGDGPERKNLEQQVERLDLKKSVKFLGEQADIVSFLQSADLFVLPSRRDNCPIALLEAMAGGLPVISTKVGGIPEIVKSGEHGLLVEPEKPALLAQAIFSLFSQRSLARQLGRQGRQTAQHKFDLGQFGEKVFKLFA